jgi:hypothetical protein
MTASLVFAMRTAAWPAPAVGCPTLAECGPAHAGVGEAGGQVEFLAVGGVTELLAQGRLVVLAVGVDQVGEQLGALADEESPAAQQVTGGAHGLGGDVGDGQVAAAEEACDLLGVEVVVLGLAAVDGLHVQGVAEHEGDPFLVAEVGEPVPGEHALAGDGQAGAEGRHGFKDGLRGGGDGVVEDDGTLGIEDADRQGPGMEVDAAGKLVGLGVEPHHGLRGMGDWLLVTPVYPLRRGHDEYPVAAADGGREAGFAEQNVSLRGRRC